MFLSPIQAAPILTGDTEIGRQKHTTTTSKVFCSQLSWGVLRKLLPRSICQAARRKDRGEYAWRQSLWPPCEHPRYWAWTLQTNRQRPFVRVCFNSNSKKTRPMRTPISAVAVLNVMKVFVFIMRPFIRISRIKRKSEMAVQSGRIWLGKAVGNFRFL